MQNNAGFTIIEVVIAISILAVGLLGVAAMQTSAIQVNSAAGRMTTRINWDITDNTPVPNTKRIVVTVTGKGKTSQLTCMKADW